ncbi:Bug family tripartite tricarboxylate transporter substrate binding protein [Candidimonas nitroreducens]|nr:tripartite tricarboxylate transporter substrate binding protein [Candidimonas nitroreducens]
MNATGGYASRPIKLFVGYAAGGTADVVARMLAKEIGNSLGASVVVENKAGANALIATNELRRSKPDGYTILMASLSHVVNPVLHPKEAQYDPVRDFAPIAGVVTLPLVIVTSYNSPYQSVADLISVARKEPGHITFASAGVGGSGHLAGAMLAQSADVDMLHVPFNGNAPGLSEVIAGRVSFMFYPTIGIANRVQQKQVRVLAVATSERMADFPNVPTLQEIGYTGFERTAIWLGILAPKGTPKNIVKLLHQEVAKALHKPEVQRRLSSLGALTVNSDPAQFSQFLASDHARWSNVIQKAGIQGPQQ